MSGDGFDYCLHARDLYGDDPFYKLDESVIDTHEPEEVLKQLYESFLAGDDHEDFQYVTLKHKDRGWLIVLETVDGDELYEMSLSELQASSDNPDEVLIEMVRRYHDEKVDLYYSVQRKVKRFKK